MHMPRGDFPVLLRDTQLPIGSENVNARGFNYPAHEINATHCCLKAIADRFNCPPDEIKTMPDGIHCLPDEIHATSRCMNAIEDRIQLSSRRDSCNEVLHECDHGSDLCDSGRYLRVWLA